MDKGANADIIHTGSGIVFDVAQVDAAAGFRLEAAADERKGIQQPARGEVVEQDPVHLSDCKHPSDLVDRSGLYLYFEMWLADLAVDAGFFDGGLDAAGVVDMVIFQEDHIVEPKPVVDTS